MHTVSFLSRLPYPLRTSFAPYTFLEVRCERYASISELPKIRCCGRRWISDLKPAAPVSANRKPLPYKPKVTWRAPQSATLPPQPPSFHKKRSLQTCLLTKLFDPLVQGAPTDRRPTPLHGPSTSRSPHLQRRADGNRPRVPGHRRRIFLHRRPLGPKFAPAHRAHAHAHVCPRHRESGQQGLREIHHGD